MATPETFTLNQFSGTQLVVTAPDGSGNSGLIVAYEVFDVTGQGRKPKTKTLTLTPTQQTQINNLWSAAITAAKNQEGIA